ncbi:MAG: hydroxyacid dehydrogenase [Verrucomicrobia bacterium]|jgi:D-lactate dehydrogenase|nr:hydroxyacid dehydrogenase [Verrucomicrobiota bacterium]
MHDKKLDVFFFEAFEEEETALRAHLPAGIKAAFTADTIQEWGSADPKATIISIRTQSQIPLDWAPGLGGILTRSTGYDHVLRYLAQTGTAPAAGHLPIYCNRAVAEQALLLWMALLRRLPVQQAHFRKFHRDGITGHECREKTLAVFGVGNIGYEVVRIGRGLDMHVVGVDIDQRHPDVNYMTPGAALAAADIVVCAMNLTAENEGYFNTARWSHIKPGALFINIARGELASAVELTAALDAGHLAGVGLDVYNHEPELAVALRQDQPSADPEVIALLALSQRSDVICTPHNAFNTAESVTRKAAQSIEQIETFLKTGTFLWPLPVPGGHPA